MIRRRAWRETLKRKDARSESGFDNAHRPSSPWTVTNAYTHCI